MVGNRVKFEALILKIEGVVNLALNRPHFEKSLIYWISISYFSDKYLANSPIFGPKSLICWIAHENGNSQGDVLFTY